jgi:hypothetical protein
VKEQNRTEQNRTEQMAESEKYVVPEGLQFRQIKSINCLLLGWMINSLRPINQSIKVLLK